MRLELAQKIENAFANTTYPGDNNMGASDVDELVGQRDWRQVPLKTLLWNQTDMQTFSPQAFHFYVPAFLCAVLRNPEAEDMADSIIYELTPSSPGESIKSIAEWAFPLFSDQQKAVILEFLQMYEDLSPGSAFNLLDRGKAQLQRTMQFWSHI
jgi:uncharacterized protein DUF6714